MRRCGAPGGHRGKGAVQHLAQLLRVGDGFRMAKGRDHRPLVWKLVQTPQALAQRVAAA